MIEAEWLGRDTPSMMLLHLQKVMGQRKDARRKIRLWMVACCRQVWPEISSSRSRNLIEASEPYADGEVSFAELKGLWNAHREKVGSRTWGARLAWEASHRDAWPGALSVWAILSGRAGLTLEER